MRVFGYRTTDLKQRIVEVAVTVEEACSLIDEARGKGFGEVEVGDSSWAYCVNVSGVKLVYWKEET